MASNLHFKGLFNFSRVQLPVEYSVVFVSNTRRMIGRNDIQALRACFLVTIFHLRTLLDSGSLSCPMSLGVHTGRSDEIVYFRLRKHLGVLKYFSHGMRLSALGTAATVWPIVPASDD
jgi:hypothetical protein